MKNYTRKYRRRKTRLTRLEERRNIKQAFVFGFLSIFLILALIFIGLPLLIKLAIAIGDRKSAQQKPEKTDTVAPNPPTFFPAYEATHSATISLEGYAEEEATVKIVLNGKLFKEVTADSQGDFKIKSLTLKEGENRIKAKAIDKEDNKSDFSDELIITLDTKSPDLEISSPNDGDKFFDKDKEIDIEGSTEENATVYINNRLATVDSQGNFSLNLELKDGENKIEVRVEDLAGNETKQEITVSYSP